MTLYRAYIDSLAADDYLPRIRAGLDYIRFGTLVSGDTRIFIKPNLTYPEYKPGVMTNPAAVAAAIQAVHDYTPHIWIGDSDSGGYNRFSMDSVYDATGMRDICRPFGAQIVNLSSLPRRAIHFRYAGHDFSLDLPVLLLDEIEFTLTMPVPKVHGNTGVSLSFKNQWGCIPENKDRLRLHPYFQHVIFEVNKAIKTQFAIVDGKFGLNRNGPLRGDPVELGWVLVTDNIGAAARLACKLMQIDLRRVAHLRYLERRGAIPGTQEIALNQALEPFIKTRFYLNREWTDLPGLLAFKSPLVAYLAYFSPLAPLLHKLLYLVREPFYDYGRH